jgi:predicted RNA-binding protein with PUA-like domain
MKSEPEAYSWAKLVADGTGRWDGVRNHQAANNLRAMEAGDRAFFYHSSTGKEIVGVMEITSAAEPDATDPTGKWVMVGVRPLMPAKTPVALSAIRADPRFADFLLVRHTRLSVMPVSPAYWRALCAMAGIKA